MGRIVLVVLLVLVLGSPAGRAQVTTGPSQPQDSDLDIYAGITPSANVQSFLGAADYAAMRSQLGLVIGTNVQAFDADLSTYAGITPSANVQSLLGAANYAAMRTQLGLVIGTDVQAFDTELGQIAGLADPNADRILFWDDSAGSYAFLTAGNGLSISTTTISLSDGDKGDITVSGTGATWTIDNNAVSYAKLQDVSATQRVIGRNTAGAGDPEEVTVSQVLDWISSTRGTVLYRGASGWAALNPGTSGQVLHTNGAGADPTWDADDGAGGGAPADIDYLVGTASGSLSAEIVVGTSPGGELGGTWASPTIDADAVLWNEIGDAGADATIAMGANETDWTSTIDASGEAVLTITNTDADAANDNSFLDLRHNDGADANVFYARFIGDNDGTPSNDYLFSQTAFTIGSGVATTFNGSITVPNDSFALGTKTTGNYAAGDAEAGNALTGDSATAFFSAGQIERARGGTGADTSGYGAGLLGSDGSNNTIDVDTMGELETAIGGANIIQSTEIDTIAELEALLGGANVIVSTEIDTVGEINTLAGDDDFLTLAGSQTVTGAKTFNALTVANALTLNNGIVYADASMGALAVDVTELNNTKTISTDSTLTFSGTPAASGQIFGLQLTNSDTAAHTITIPSSKSEAMGGAARTTFTIAAGQIVTIKWRYEGSSTYTMWGEPVRILDLTSATVAGADSFEFYDVTDGLSKRGLITDLESPLEAVMDLQEMQGAVTDAQVPNNITIDLATTAATANAGDSATAFFSSGQIERARGGTGADTSGYGAGLLGSDGSNNTIDVDTATELSTAIGGETSGTGSFARVDSPAFTTQITAPKVVWTGSIQDLTGSGSPEGSVTAAVGSIYRRTDGGASTTIYVKETGSGNTGWVAYGPPGGSGAPADATYITQTANGSLSAEQALGALSSGFLSVTTTTGVVASRSLAEGLAIDITNTTGGGNPSFAFDPTELAGSRTWGDGSTDTIVWTFDRATGTDPTFTFGNGVVTISGVAPLASPALTGDPTAPTASAGDNDTSAATTAFVQAAARDTVTGTHASPSTTNPLSPTWNSVTQQVWYGVTGTINLPAASGYAGRSIIVYNTGAFTITIDPNGSEVVVRDGTVQTGGVSFTLSSGAGNYVALICDGARWITLGFKGTLSVGS